MASILCEFRFRCDKAWDELAEISGETAVRYCSDCAKPVFRCTSYEQLAEHVAESRCVAISTDDEVSLVGMAAPIYGRGGKPR